MTNKEAIARLKANRDMFVFEETKQAIDMAIEALSADTVSREEYEELYRKAKEVNEMANDILADFPSYKELLSVANLKEEFESAVPNCQKCAIKELWEATEKEDLVSVVRCKDCRHQRFYINDKESFYCDKSGIVNMHIDDGDGEFFCKYGERR